MSEKYAIIGAGFSGLGVAAAFLRHGIAFDVLEADDDLGGNWYHGVYSTVHIISSKKTTAYADFPMPADYPDFPSAAQMLAYLRAFADARDLRRHIQLKSRVTRVERAARGGWSVTVEGRAPVRYAGVIVCNGHHWERRWPEYPGSLTVPMMHSKDYKSPADVAGKRVLVLGGGNSACDIAVEAGRVGQAAHISLRRGYWFMPKTFFGVPMVELLRPWMPVAAQRVVIRALVRVVVGRYQSYGLPAPDHAPFEKHPTINGDLLIALRNGAVTPHPDVRRWDGNVVEFVDGTRLEVDLVVAATGFDVSFPFLEDGVVPWKDGMPQLVGSVVPEATRDIYFFGFSQPRYGAGPLISAGAEVLAAMVEAQPRLRHPIGALLRRIGGQIPRTYLADPFAALRQMRLSRWLIPRLPALERWLMPGAPATPPAHETLATPRPERVRPSA